MTSPIPHNPTPDTTTPSHAPDLCAASGHEGLMHPIPGTDDWKIECPTCHTWWHGGSIILDPHTPHQPR